MTPCNISPAAQRVKHRLSGRSSPLFFVELFFWLLKVKPQNMICELHSHRLKTRKQLDLDTPSVTGEAGGCIFTFVPLCIETVLICTVIKTLNTNSPHIWCWLVVTATSTAVDADYQEWP